MLQRVQSAADLACGEPCGACFRTALPVFDALQGTKGHTVARVLIFLVACAFEPTTTMQPRNSLVQSSKAWIPVSETVLHKAANAATLAGYPCQYAHKHSCLGICRNVGAIDKGSPALRLAWFDVNGSRSEAVHPLSGLRKLLQQAASPRSTSHWKHGTCELAFVGDSVTCDSFWAMLSGALQLGLHLEYCVWPRFRGRAYEQRYFARENDSFCEANPMPAGVYEDNTSNMSRSRANPDFDPSARAVLRVPGEWKAPCKTLQLRNMLPADLVARPQLARLLLSNPAATLIVNHGLWAKTEEAYEQSLNELVRPFLELHASYPKGLRAVVLWRETTPQHFKTKTGTGLFSEQSHSSQERPCSPIGPSPAQRQRASWWNGYFKNWSKHWSLGANRSLQAILPVFSALADRHDLHVAPDCTHYCFTPFTWLPMWHAAATALEHARRED